MSSIIIRADAGTRMGTGHVMRCIAMAQACRRAGAEVCILSCCDSEGICQRVESAGIEFVKLDVAHPAPGDLEYTQRVADQRGAEWIVTDGYHFDLRFQRAVRQAGKKLLVVDDYCHMARYEPDILLNQNIGAEEFDYSLLPDTKTMLGPTYAMLREEFTTVGLSGKGVSGSARNILVTLGGGDPDNLSLAAMKAMLSVVSEEIHVRVIIGAANPHIKLLEAESQRQAGRFEILRNVEDMPALIRWADLAVSAGGSTCWEMCLLELPMILIAAADNQRLLVSALHEKKIAVSLGWHEQVSESHIGDAITSLIDSDELRVSMSRRGRKLVDGKGASRVAQVLTSGE